VQTTQRGSELLQLSIEFDLVAFRFHLGMISSILRKLESETRLVVYVLCGSRDPQKSSIVSRLRLRRRCALIEPVLQYRSL
jgi:hypothetical protein